MTSITLKVNEAAELKDQLRTLASHQLPGDIKFKIYENINELEASAKSYMDSRNDLIKQFGEPFRGQMAIREFIGEKGDQPNPKAADFKTEIEKLDATEKEFQLHFLPRKLFSEDRELGGDIYLIAKYLVEKTK